MKTLITLVFLLFVGTAQAFDQYTVIEGRLLSRPVTLVWNDTGVSVTPEAEKYPEAIVQAYEQPGKPVEASRKEVTTDQKMVDLFHHKNKIATFHANIVYDTEKGMIDVVGKETLVPTKDIFNPYLIWWVIAIVAMMVARRWEGVALGAAIIAGGNIATIFASTSTTTVSIIAIAINVLIATVASLVVGGNKAQYKIYSRLFYVLMVLSAGVVYYPLVSN